MVLKTHLDSIGSRCWMDVMQKNTDPCSICLSPMQDILEKSCGQPQKNRRTGKEHSSEPVLPFFGAALDAKVGFQSLL
ncbi:hypothetical protein TNCV_3563381 [Trichonephila clavipes]|nr:hypothetical protein TNCV_3563381 [Trichonephila clavipes]